MAMKKSIGRTLAHIDVAANSSVRIHKDFFNTHPCSQHLSGNTLVSDFRASQAAFTYKNLMESLHLPYGRWLRVCPHGRGESCVLRDLGGCCNVEISGTTSS